MGEITLKTILTLVLLIGLMLFGVTQPPIDHMINLREDKCLSGVLDEFEIINPNRAQLWIIEIYASLELCSGNDSNDLKKHQ